MNAVKNEGTKLIKIKHKIIDWVVVFAWLFSFTFFSLSFTLFTSLKERKDK